MYLEAYLQCYIIGHDRSILFLGKIMIGIKNYNVFLVVECPFWEKIRIWLLKMGQLKFVILYVEGSLHSQVFGVFNIYHTFWYSSYCFKGTWHFTWIFNISAFNASQIISRCHYSRTNSQWCAMQIGLHLLCGNHTLL